MHTNIHGLVLVFAAGMRMRRMRAHASPGAGLHAVCCCLGSVGDSKEAEVGRGAALRGVLKLEAAQGCVDRDVCGATVWLVVGVDGVHAVKISPVSRHLIWP